MKPRVWLLTTSAIICSILIGCSDDNPTGVGNVPSFYDQARLASRIAFEYRSSLDTLDPATARLAIIRDLHAESWVTEAGLSADSTTVWWTLRSGVQYLFLTATRFQGEVEQAASGQLAAARSGAPPATDDRSALVLSPNHWEHQHGSQDLVDECVPIAQALESAGLATVQKLHGSYDDTLITLQDYAAWSDYDVFVYAGHCALSSSATVCLVSGVSVDEAQMSEQEANVLAGRILPVVLAREESAGNHSLYWGLTPEWFAQHSATGIEQGVVYLGAGLSLFNDDLATVLTGDGSACFGWDHRVSGDEASWTGRSLFTNLLLNGDSFWESLVALYASGHGREELPPGYGQDVSHFLHRGDLDGHLIARRLQVACTPAGYDDFATAVAAAGVEPMSIELTELTIPDSLAGFDVIFVNCAEGLEAIAEASATSLRDFVTEGGTLVASDFAFAFLENAFPDSIHAPDFPYIGAAGSVSGRFEGSALEEHFGAPNVALEFPLGSWVVVDSVGTNASVLVEAYVETIDKGGDAMRRGVHRPPAVSRDKRASYRPVLVQFPVGEGAVFFSSFDFRSQDPVTARRIVDFILIEAGGASAAAGSS